MRFKLGIILTLLVVLLGCGGGIVTRTVQGASGGPTKTPSSTPVAPTVQLAASPNSIQSGQSTTLTWSSNNADSVNIQPGIGMQGPSGSMTITPTSSTTYVATATGSGGTATSSAVVAVSTGGTSKTPPTVQLIANPTTVSIGQSTTLSWTMSNATSVDIEPGVGLKISPGSATVTPSATTTYTATAVGPGGSTVSTVLVTVSSSPAAPTVQVSGSPTSISSGQFATISWNSANATSVNIQPSIGTQGPAGSATVTPTSTTTYTATATGPGGTANATFTLTVTSSSPVKGGPTVQLTASQTTITSGQTTTLSWNSSNATSVDIEPGIGVKGTSGSVVVSPSTTTTYTATASGGGGATATSAVVVTVTSPNPPPTIAPTVQLIALPTTIQAGQSTTLTWTSTNATSVDIEPGIGQKAASGSITVSPTSTTTYTATASGSAGTATTSAVVTVTAAPAVTVQLSAIPSSISSGQSSTLTWSSSNATSVSIQPTVGSQPLSGSTAVSPTATTTYTITATGPGGTATAVATVTVAPPPPPGPPTVELSAVPTSIQTGQATTLSWSSTNATSVDIQPSVGVQAASGTVSVSPTSTTTYTATATGSGGTASTTVTVNVSAAPPVTVQIAALPTSIQTGSSSTLTWSSSNATSVDIQPGVGMQGPAGTASVSPTNTTTYTATATGASGTATASATVTVSSTPPPPPPATPSVVLTANPASIQPGQSSTLSWTSTNATSVDIEPGVGVKGTSGTISVSPASTTTYTATAVGSGSTAISTATVTVTSTPPPTPIGGALPTGIIGLGQSTLTCIDVDGDGYGTGPGCLGPDADDSDSSVHSTADVLSKWGSIQAFLVHRGYTWIGSSTRYWVLSPTGNDTACGSIPYTFGANPDPTVVQACATWGQIQYLIAPGDVIFGRGGTYAFTWKLFNSVSGTSAAPLLYISYPGELAVVDAATGFDINSGDPTITRNYITVDGFKFIYSTDNVNGDKGIYLGFNDHLTIRNVEIGRGLGRGIYTSPGLSNVTIEYNKIYDQNLYGNKSHGMYLTSRVDIGDNYNITIRNNIVSNPGRTCIQHGGGVSNLIIDGNICYNIPFNSAAGISLEQHVHDSFIRNNLVFNADVKPLDISDYASDIATNLPRDQVNNVFENNTFVVPSTRWEDGSPNGTTPNVTIAAAGPGVPCGTVIDLGHNTFLNNLLINYSGGTPVQVISFASDATSTYSGYGDNDPRTWVATLTWENNDIYQLSQTGKVVTYTNQQTILGSPPCAPSAITGTYDWTQWLALNNTTTGNISVDPLFAAYNNSWTVTPQNFNFSLQPTSPGVNAGLLTSTEPAYDLLGMGRTSTPSMGAFQYPTGGTSLQANSWLMVPTHGIPAGAVGWEKLIYVRNARKFVYLGTYHEPSSEPNQAMLSYDFETNRWDLLDMVGYYHEEYMPDAGHPDGSFVFDSGLGVITYLCCGSGSNQMENLWHTWWYDVVGQVGRDKHTSPKPNTVFDHQQTGAFYDVASGRFIVFNAGATSSYDDQTNGWTSLTPSGTIPTAGIAMIDMTYNSANGLMYAFGGLTSYSPAAYSNDVYTYNSSTNTWSLLSPSGTRPSPRMKAGWAYDSRNNIILMFGGENSTVLNDTWVFDPSANGGQGSWTELTPAQNPPIASFAPFERMDYDPDHNVFVLVLPGTGGYADGTYSNYPVQTWLFRYAGPGPSVGALSSTAAPTAGSINRNRSGWGRGPALATSGTALYAAWSETGLPFDNTPSQWAHIYVDSLSGGTWQQLGSTSSSINSENTGDTEAHAPSITLIGGTPWVSYYSGKYPVTLPQVYARSWNGSSWSGGAVGLVNNSPGVTQSRSSIVGVGSTPYLALIEVDKSQSALGQQHFVYLKHFNGTSWVQDGTFANRDSGRYPATPYTIASSISMATDGTTPWVAWTEYTTANTIFDTVPQVYVSQWNGTSWTPVGGSLNTDTSHWASDVTITNVAGKFYVAWTERTQSGNNQLFVKTFNGSSWVLVGSGALNTNAATGWAFRPSLTGDSNGNVYVGWVEQPNVGQHAQVYVSKFNGSSWTPLGGSLNANSTLGSSLGISLSILGGQPVAAWGEVNYGTKRQVFVKQWNGSQWVLIPGGTQGP